MTNELRAIAEAATPGPWFFGVAYEAERGPKPFDYTGPGYYDNGGIMGADGTTVVGCDEYDVFKSPQDVAFIATFDPPTVLRLLADLEAAEARVGDMQLALDWSMGVAGALEPGDSRAVSNEFVAAFSIQCDQTERLDECRDILRTALANPTPTPPANQDDQA